MGLAPEDVDTLLGIDADELDLQAESLIKKRFWEVGSKLVHTVGQQRDLARSEFFSYAENYWPKGHDRHIKDALEFCHFLKQKSSISVNAFEFDWLRFMVSDKRMGVRFYQKDFQLAESKIGLVVFYRYKKASYYRWWSLPSIYSKG